MIRPFWTRLLDYWPNTIPRGRCCEDTAILYGGAKSVSRSGGRQRQNDEDGNQPHPSAPWTLHIAYNISRVVTPLQRDLLDEKRLLYFVGHWCSTLSERQPGCAYADCCVVYDRRPQQVTLMQPSPDLNIYMRVPHPRYSRCLSDLVLDVAKQRLQKFFRQTFWCHEMFFRRARRPLPLRSGEKKLTGEFIKSLVAEALSYENKSCYVLTSLVAAISFW